MNSEHLRKLPVDAHATLRLGVFESRFPSRLGDLIVTEAITNLLGTDVTTPLVRDEFTRQTIRDLLRVGGYKPTGRGKPASEYLVRAQSDGALRSINMAVDLCNAVSVHSGLPISVIDLEHTAGEIYVAIAPSDTRYVFNPAGQEIDVSGLICLFDEEGPTATPVKDAQRTKTSSDTTKTLSLIWSCEGLEHQLETTMRWYTDLLHEHGVETFETTPTPRN